MAQDSAQSGWSSRVPILEYRQDNDGFSGGHLDDALEYRREDSRVLRRLPGRVLIALSGVVVVTVLGYKVIPVNATTVGFAYLLVVLLVATAWGFLEAALASILATLVFNFFFLPPVGTFTIATELGRFVKLFGNCPHCQPVVREGQSPSDGSN